MSFNNTRTPTKSNTKPKYPVPMRPNGKNGIMAYYMEGELKQKFCRLFTIHSNRRIMQWFGISFSTVQRFKREFGLEKNMKVIRKEQARDIKKTCERNGYYDSIRGKRPSEACMEAARKKRAAGFCPITRLRETDPRKYEATMRLWSERRKELVRKERLRRKYGLEQKTSLRITLDPISHRASQQKHLMVKKRNYFADPSSAWSVCYDSLTLRSTRMEATARKHGLRVVQADEDDGEQ